MSLFSSIIFTLNPGKATVLIKKFISGWNLWKIYCLQTSKPDIEVLNTFYWGLVNWICFQGLSFLFIELKKKKKKNTFKVCSFLGGKEKAHFRKKGKVSGNCARQHKTREESLFPRSFFSRLCKRKYAIKVPLIFFFSETHANILGEILIYLCDVTIQMV